MTGRRPPRRRFRFLEDLRRALIDEVLADHAWWNPTDAGVALNVRASDSTRVALVLERMANDGELELERGPGRVRRFRLVTPACREHPPERPA